MMLIPCPHCGPRNETEFSYGGQAHVSRPEDPQALDDAAWARYLFYRDNPKGLFAERWVHSAGCRKWFNAVRNTITYEVRSVEPIGPQSPHARSAESTTSEGGHL
ncbi:sarcosine oxidase subunit delta [Nesterenkonia suensis]